VRRTAVLRDGSLSRLSKYHRVMLAVDQVIRAGGHAIPELRETKWPL
jgi:hypothetical protein